MAVDDLFFNVVFHIDDPSFEYADEILKLEALLVQHGATKANLISPSDSKFCEKLPISRWNASSDATHIFTRNKLLLCRTREKCRADLNAKVLVPEWISHSLSSRELCATPNYELPTQLNQFFRGMFVHAIDLDRDEAVELYSLIEQFGGHALVEHSENVTHVVSKSQTSTTFPHQPFAPVISPLYFGLCVYLGRCLQIPQNYIIKEAVPEFLPNTLGVASWIKGTTWHVSKSLWAYLDQDNVASNSVGSLLVDILTRLVNYGALLVPRSQEAIADGVDFVVSEFRVDTDKICGNLFWLQALLSTLQFKMPAESVFWMPVSAAGVSAQKTVLHNSCSMFRFPVLQNARVSISGFTGSLRLVLQYYLSLLGATFTSSLDRHNTHLITHDERSTKTVMARAWGLHVVNILWLEACVGSFQYIKETSNSAFTVFDPVLLGAAVGSWSFLSLNEVSKSCAPTPRKPKRPHDAAFTPPSKVSAAKSLQVLGTTHKSERLGDSKLSSVCIATTACRLTQAHLDGIQKLGGKLLAHPVGVDDIVNCTHLVSPKLLRTEKLLVAVGRGKWVVLPSWIDQSIEAGYWLDEKPFLVCEEPECLEVTSSVQILSPIGAQSRRHKLANQLAMQKKLYESYLRAQKALQKGEANPSAHLFQGKTFHVLNSTVPNPSVVSKLVVFGGGRISLSVPVADEDHFYILTHATNNAALNEYKLQGYKVIDWEYLLTAILDQDPLVDISSYTL